MNVRKRIIFGKQIIMEDEDYTMPTYRQIRGITKQLSW